SPATRSGRSKPERLSSGRRAPRGELLEEAGEVAHAHQGAAAVAVAVHVANGVVLQETGEVRDVQDGRRGAVITVGVAGVPRPSPGAGPIPVTPPDAGQSAACCPTAPAHSGRTAPDDQPKASEPSGVTPVAWSAPQRSLGSNRNPPALVQRNAAPSHGSASPT